jgi:peptide/nickel transport system substrate-binding protein
MALVCSLLVALAACAPAGSTSSGVRTEPAGASSASGSAPASKTLNVILLQEPETLAGTSMFGRTQSTGGRRRIFNAGLALRDADNEPIPYLAESLPDLRTDSWRVEPDGRMETTYRLRPNLAWHDGAALTADDFVFAHQVYATPQLGQSGTEPINMIQEVLAPDPRTVVIRWRGAYAEAGALEGVVSSGVPTGGPSFSPLPRHILQRSFDEQLEGFLLIPFWTVEFIGAGPYKVARWETGAFIDASAFDQHALGRPKIDRLRLTWNSDPNAILATLLSGEAHFVVDGALGVASALVLKREWEVRNAGVVKFNPKNWHYIGFQLRPDYANPRALLDLRVRKALAYSIDKEALNDGVFEGTAVLTDFLMYASVPYFADLDQAVVKYPLDPGRSARLMEEAGYRKGADGLYEGAEGRLTFQIKGSPPQQSAKTRAIQAAVWRQAGFEVEEAAYTPQELQDGQAVATFRSMRDSGSPPGIQGMGLFTSSTIPTPDNRWVGGNRTGWSSSDYDRAYNRVQSTLDATERGQFIVQAARVFTEQLPGASLYFQPWVVLLPSAIRGMNQRAPDADETWNIFQWEMT